MTSISFTNKIDLTLVYNPHEKIEYNSSVTISQCQSDGDFKTLFERSVKANVVPSQRPSQQSMRRGERTKRLTILEIEGSKVMSDQLKPPRGGHQEG